VGAGQEYLLDIKNLAALGIIAGTTRVGVIGMLALKGYWNEKLVERRGIASDPVSKGSKELFGKAWPGYAALQTGMEGAYLTSSLLSLGTLGWAAALTTDTVQNLTGISKMAVEVWKMRQWANGIHTPGEEKGPEDKPNATAANVNSSGELPINGHAPVTVFGDSKDTK
jgi:hypothetical protein